MTNYIDPETGEILAARSLGVGEDGPQFTRLHPDLVQRAGIDLGDIWADANAAASLLEETRRSVRARMSRGYRKGGLGVSDAEAAAESSPEYVAHVEAMVEARRLADRAKIRLDSFKVAWETAKVVAYVEKQAMKM